MIDKIKELICNYVEADAASITEDTKFIEDLNFTSYDFMCMLGDLEEEYGITVDESDILNIHTVGEAAEYIEKLAREK